MSLRKIKIPNAFDNLIGLAGTTCSFLLVIYVPILTELTVFRLFLYLFCVGCLIFFPHSLAHFVVGSLLGIRFRHYVIGRSSISKLPLPVNLPSLPVLTLKLNRQSLIQTSPRRRAAMFASGAIVSIPLPFFVVAAVFHNLPFSLWLLLFLAILANAAFNSYYGPKAGDLSRARAAA